jgi:hypothetical protein
MNTRVLALAAAPVVALGLGCKTDGTATAPATAPRAPPGQAAGRPAPSPVVGSLTGRVAEITDYVLTIGPTQGFGRRSPSTRTRSSPSTDGPGGRPIFSSASRCRPATAP